eukprot:7183098-Heterocapsa_arctica.AAC.1
MAGGKPGAQGRGYDAIRQDADDRQRKGATGIPGAPGRKNVRCDHRQPHGMGAQVEATGAGGQSVLWM